MNIDNNGWIQLFTGKKFFPMNPQAEYIDIADIAHSLSNMCRFTGHSSEFYSVAQHCVLVSYQCGEHALQGLLHDASEAYICDVSSPIKRLKEFDSYRDVEKQIQSTVYRKFGLPEVEPKEVKIADIRMLATEAKYLMAPLHVDWKQPAEPYDFEIVPLAPKEAKKLFLERFEELTCKNS